MKKIKVLVVDDDRSFLDELKSMLNFYEYAVEAIDDVSSVVKNAQQKQPDIIFLDMKMPGQTGFQVACDLKHFPTTANIPIIALTGQFVEKQHENFIKSIGICDCILKPFDPQDLITKIGQYAGGAKGAH